MPRAPIPPADHKRAPGGGRRPRAGVRARHRYEVWITDEERDRLVVRLGREPRAGDFRDATVPPSDAVE